MLKRMLVVATCPFALVCLALLTPNRSRWPPVTVALEGADSERRWYRLFQRSQRRPDSEDDPPRAKCRRFREPANRPKRNGLRHSVQTHRLRARRHGTKTRLPGLTRTDMKSGPYRGPDRQLSGAGGSSELKRRYGGRCRPDLFSRDNPGKAVYRFDPDGKTDADFWPRRRSTNANGLTIAPDDKTFYLNRGEPPGANGTRRITAFDLNATGSPSNSPCVSQLLSRDAAVDGMTIDSGRQPLGLRQDSTTLRNNTEDAGHEGGHPTSFAPDGPAVAAHSRCQSTCSPNVAFGGSGP